MRIVWTVFLAVVALLACGAQLDRAARRQPALATVVPAPFRNFAQESMTLATVRSAEPSVALAEARTLVSRSPTPAEHLTLLAIAEERSGDRTGSARLIQRAAQRGWRDPIAQQAMFDIALGAGDPVEASHRLAALWALQEEQAPLKDMGQRLMSQPQGRKALADSLVAGGSWANSFLRSVAADPTTEAVETVDLALRSGASIDCDVAARLKTAYTAKAVKADVTLLDKCTRKRG